MNARDWGISLVGLSGCIGVVLLWCEWKRTNQQHRAERLVATTLAIICLGGFLWRSWTKPNGSVQPLSHTANLWTATSDRSTTIPAEENRVVRVSKVGSELEFALPGVRGAPAAAVTIPDLGYLRRHFPDITGIHIFGGGVEPGEIEQLRGLSVEFKPESDRRTHATVLAVRAPGQIVLGEPLVVEGRIGGLSSGQSVAISLVSPGGEVTTADVRADQTGESGFLIKTAPPVTLGLFEWELRLTRSRESPEILEEGKLGVAITAPVQPRVLILESGPRLDSARLRRWYAGTRGFLTSRTKVSRDRFQFSASQGEPNQFDQVGPALLAGFDLLLLDGGALAALSTSERSAIRKSVEDSGLGVLLLADDDMLGGTSGLKDEVDRSFFLPWRLTAVGEADPSNDRRTVQLAGLDDRPIVAEGISAAPFAIDRASDQWGLLFDGQGREVAAMTARGLGRVGISLVFDTWRWTQEADAASSFPAYWSLLMGRLARPQSEDEKGRWLLAANSPTPIYANRLVHLQRVGGKESDSGIVRATNDNSATRLTLLEDANESRTWRSEFWPRQAGWHRVKNERDGPVFDFYVQNSNEWPAVQAERRRAATALRAILNPLPVPAARHVSPGQRSDLWLFAIFFVAAAYLWIEGRGAWRPLES